MKVNRSSELNFKIKFSLVFSGVSNSFQTVKLNNSTKKFKFITDPKSVLEKNTIHKIQNPFQILY
jgi:hypothetical protein